MTDQDIRTVLARMAGARPDGTPEAEVTPARALRTAFGRAAESAGGLKASASSVAEESVALDAVAAALSEGDLALALRTAEGGVIGVAALDRELRAAFVEAQTMGRLSAVPAPARPVSVADAALCAPVIDAFLTETALAAAPTALAGWTDGVWTGGRIDGARGVALTLPEEVYRLLRLEVDPGVTGRSGRLLLALPAGRGELAPAPAPSDWSDRLHRSVLSAPAVLTAVLHRMTLPLSRLEEMVVDDLLPLEGVTVSSVRLEGAGQTVVATARLGQVGGMKAVRLEPPPPPDLREVTPPRVSGPVLPPSAPAGPGAGPAPDGAAALDHDLSGMVAEPAALPPVADSGLPEETAPPDMAEGYGPGARPSFDQNDDPVAFAGDQGALTDR